MWDTWGWRGPPPLGTSQEFCTGVGRLGSLPCRRPASASWCCTLLSVELLGLPALPPCLGQMLSGGDRDVHSLSLAL